MKRYEKPVINEEILEIEDIIAISNNGSTSIENGEKVPATDLW